MAKVDYAFLRHLRYKYASNINQDLDIGYGCEYEYYKRIKGDDAKIKDYFTYMKINVILRKLVIDYLFKGSVFKFPFFMGTLKLKRKVKLRYKHVDEKGVVSFRSARDTNYESITYDVKFSDKFSYHNFYSFSMSRMAEIYYVHKLKKVIDSWKEGVDNTNLD